MELFRCQPERRSETEEDELEERLRKHLDARLDTGLAALKAELSRELLSAVAAAGLPKTGGGSCEKEEEEILTVTAEPKEASGKAAGAQQEFHFSESIWDAATLIGTDALGLGGSVLLGLNLVLNVFVQLVFCFIVLYNLNQPVFSADDLQGLEAWRLKIAHDEKHVNTVGGYSLAERICAGDGTLEIGTWQADKLATIRGYLPDLDPDTRGLKAHLSGPLMCTLALLVWCLSLSKEVSSIMDFFGALRLVPRQAYTKLAQTEDGGFRFEVLGHLRMIFVLLVVIIRAGIATFLLIIGSMYISYTASMEELLLNACALELIVSTDELIFQAMAPSVAQELVTGLQPLPMKRWPRWRKADVKSCLLPVLLAFMLTVFWYTGIQRTVQNLTEAHSKICDGNTTFAYSVDGLGMVRVRNLPRFDQNEAWGVRDFASRAIREVRDNVEPESWLHALWTDPETITGSLGNVEGTVRAIYGTRDMGCHNALDPELPPHDPLLPFVRSQVENEWRVFPQYLQDLLGRETPISSCADVREHCFMTQFQPLRISRTMRAFCPVTCGCNSLLTGSYFTSAAFGCPQTCLANLNQTEADASPCADVAANSTDDPRLESFKAWMTEVRAHHTHDNLTLAQLATFESHPCSLAMNDIFCLPDSNGDSFLWSGSAAQQDAGIMMKVLTYMCPWSCNCNGLAIPTYTKPNDAACPVLCFCPWHPSIAIAENETTPACRVTFGWGTNAVSDPVAIDARCCYLMKVIIGVMERLGAGSASGNDYALYNTVQQSLCHPCRSYCLNTLWNLRLPSLGNRTMGQMMGAPSEGPSSLCQSES